MAPGGRDDRGRDRGGERERERGRDRDRPRAAEAAHGEGDVSGLRDVFESAELQDLSWAGGASGHVEPAVLSGCWQTSGKRVLGVRTSAAEKGPPLKVLEYEAVVTQVHDYKEKRAGGPFEKVRTLNSLGAAFGISAVSNATQPPDGDRPWTLVVTFANKEHGRRLRDLWGPDELKPLWQKVNWPEVGFKPGACHPGRAYQAVAEDCRVLVKGKGKGRGGNKARRTGR